MEIIIARAAQQGIIPRTTPEINMLYGQQRRDIGARGQPADVAGQIKIQPRCFRFVSEIGSIGSGTAIKRIRTAPGMERVIAVTAQQAVIGVIKIAG